MIMIPRKYTIISSEDVDSIDFDQVLEGNESHLHYSLDGSKTLVKYRDDQPSFLSGKQEYTHEEILAILSGDEWTSEEIN
jgi:uncharacterized protein YllA (UPF0747 family)